MTLTRYQIRNEYGLANKELYQTADKEDPEALLESGSMAGLVGVLRQLGDLAEFAAEVFHCLHEELLKTSARGNGLTMRLQQLETEFPSIEIPILSKTDHSTFFYDPGSEWHSNLQTKENQITPLNLPRCIIDSYEECRGPPQLFHLDKFDVAGSGSCLKRYSDPSLLKTRTASTVVATSELDKVERPRKPKKKASHKIGEETHEASRKSHSKLHQLFLLEHVDNGDINPDFHVKLKRRQLNGPSINSSYMEKFLESSSPYCERVHGSLDQSSPAMETEVTVYSVGEDTREHNEIEMESIADDERLEVSFVPQEMTSNEKPLPNVEGGPVICLENNNDTDAVASMESESKEAENDHKVDSNIGLTQICSVQEDLPNNGDTKKYKEMEMKSTAGDDEGDDITSNEKSLPNLEGRAVICLERSSSVNNDRDETVSMESETKEADSDDNNLGFPGFEQTQICTNEEETQTEVLTHVLHQSLEEEEEEATHMCTDFQRSSSCSDSPPNLLEDSESRSELHSNEIGLKSSEEACEIVELEKDSMLTQLPQDGSEGGTEVVLTNYVKDHQSQHVFNVETESEISLSGLVETNREIESLEPVEISSEAQLPLESDCFLPNQYINPFYTFEDSSLATADDAQDNVAPKEDETNSQDGSSMNIDGNISTFEICSENATLISDTPRDLSASSRFAKPDTAAISSYSEEEDTKTVSLVADEPEVPIPDSHFAENQTCLSNIASETEPGKDLENISYLPQESLLDNTQECLSYEHCTETQDQEQETPSETESADPITESAESLPYQVSTQECLSYEYCTETHDQEQETPSETESAGPITEKSAESLPYRFSTPSMDLTDQENHVDVSEPTIPFSIPFHETAQTDPDIMPPLPPLPPTQWLMGKPNGFVKTTETQFNSVPSFAGNGNNSFDENIPNGSVQATESQACSENHSNHVFTEETIVEEDISAATRTTLKETLNKTMEESFASSVSQLRAETQGLEEESDWRSEAMALEWFSQNLREQSNPKPLEETEFPKTLNDETQEVGKHPGIDRSTLRKVSERNRKEVEARVEENDSLLQIIRNKSSNLRPARPNFQVAAVPITNFKVAAILEKANTLRQAMAGSDDEHDSDSWSE